MLQVQLQLHCLSSCLCPLVKELNFVYALYQTCKALTENKKSYKNPWATDDYSQGKTQIKTQHAAILMNELFYWFHGIKCLVLLTTPYLLVPLITIHLLSESMQYTTESWGSSHFKTQDATLKRVHCMIRNYLKIMIGEVNLPIGVALLACCKSQENVVQGSVLLPS